VKRGELPEGWEWKRLEEIAEINSRFEKNSFNDETKVTFLPMRCVEELTGRMDTSIEKKYGEIKTGYTPIQEGDLLFAKITPCIENGKIAIAQNLINGIGFASTEFHTLKFSPDNATKFYFFYLMQEKIRQEAAQNMTGTAGQQRVPVTFLKRLKVPVPPLPVQRQIVAVLEQAETVKRQRQEADALTGALLQSVFYEMFGDPVRNERGWEVKVLNDLVIDKKSISCGPFGSQLKIGEYTADGIPVLGIDNVAINKFIQAKPKFISKEKFKQLIAFKVRDDDVLISRTGTIARTCVLPKDFGDAIIGPNLLRISLNQKEILPIFLSVSFSYFPSMIDQILRVSPGATVAVLNTENLRKIRIIVPPLALQQHFARVVEEVERIREQQVASGKEIKGLCEGLMARAFAGELVG